MVQMSVVLRHLQKHRPNWIVDYQCRRGGHQCAVGLCNAVFTDDEPATGKYHQVIEFTPHDALYNFDDRPNTKVTSTLHEVFGLPWDEELGRYTIHVSEMTRKRAERSMPFNRFVIVHYQGHSSGYKKDLEEWQAKEICQAIVAAGRTPFIIDRDKRSSIPDGEKVYRCSPEGAEQLAALIGLAEAMIGIDSGPGHVAGATDTPTLICWTKNHPVHFYDPCPNVTHLVPDSHRGLPPAQDDGVFDFFQKHYRYATYTGENGVVSQTYRWLEQVLKVPLTEMPPVVFVVRDDLASVCWAMTKARSIAGGRTIEVIVDAKLGHSTVKEFLEKLPFIRKVSEKLIGLQPPDKPVNTRGHHIFSASGRDFDGRFRLVPDTFVEDGRGIGAWLPEYAYETSWTLHLPDAMFNAACEHIQRGVHPVR